MDGCTDEETEDALKHLVEGKMDAWKDDEKTIGAGEKTQKMEEKGIN